ncbi:MAG TPA: type VI secretion system protein TssA [Candidatus Sulfotelmatobacter sp.]|nr:type VI secretion system protein TssA [Candidatus Sulfotelmatobacter sp.]
MINAEELLKPISGEKPCGEDLSYDPGIQQLETLMKGKPETQFSAAEPPDWKALNDLCLELWARSKDLRVATTLSLASLKMDGLPAFRESLLTIKGMVAGYWETFYPLLDPTDNNDPTQRVNLIAALATPMATYGDPMRFLERLREAPLTDSRQIGRFSLADIMNVESGKAAGDGQPSITAAQIEAAFRDTNPETLQKINQSVADSIALIKEIDTILTAQVGANRAPDLTELPKQLIEMQKRLAPYVAVEAAGDGAPAEGAAGGATPGTAPAAPRGITGEVQSRKDVVKMLDKICEYYKKNEPSSPVPFILQRAQRWAEMDFMALIGDLTPDSLGEIQKVTGEKPKE